MKSTHPTIARKSRRIPTPQQARAKARAKVRAKVKTRKRTQARAKAKPVSPSKPIPLRGPLAVPKHLSVKIEVIRKCPGPPPRIRTGRPRIYDFHLLEPGYMVEYSNTTSGAVCAAVSRYKSGQPGQTFTVSKLPNGNVGVWRIT